MITCIEVSPMTRHSSKSTKLRNLNAVRDRTGNVSSKKKKKKVVHGQLFEPDVCLSDLYDVFLLDIVRDTRQNLWTIIYRSE